MGGRGGGEEGERGDQRGMDDEGLLLDAAKKVLQERVLTVVLDSSNVTEGGVHMLSRFFGWPRVMPSQPMVQPMAAGKDIRTASAAEIGMLRRKVALDSRLFEFATRLSEEVRDSRAGQEGCDRVA